jgi:hypothetical protein
VIDVNPRCIGARGDERLVNVDRASARCHRHDRPRARALLDEDDAERGPARHGPQQRDIHVVAREPVANQPSRIVVADASRERDRDAQPRKRDGCRRRAAATRQDPVGCRQPLVGRR